MTDGREPVSKLAGEMRVCCLANSKPSRSEPQLPVSERKSLCRGAECWETGSARCSDEGTEISARPSACQELGDKITPASNPSLTKIDFR